MVRGWIDKFAHLGNPLTLTDYVRVAFGHLVMDEIWNKDVPLITILRKALFLFKKRGFNKKKYKSSGI